MKLDFGALPQRIGRALQGVFGSANQRSLAKYDPIVKAVNDLDGWAKAMTKEQMQQRTREWRELVQSGKKTLDDALPEVFAMTREAAMREIGLRPFDVQLIGGAVLHQGKIAEMGTGEGKTLVATLPAALNAVAGLGVFVVTVNDYLAKRDRDWMAPVFEYLGLSVGAIQSSMSPQARQSEYACDITYGTNNEFGFDYLRDNMKWRKEEQVQKNLSYAIVDEVDSILIDEARTPLIISGENEGTTEKFVHADRIARQLKDEEHFEIKLKEHQVLLNEAGIARCEQLVGVESFYSDPQLMEWPHLLETALRAHHIYHRDKHYVAVQPKGPDGRPGDPEIVIVDEFTGRLMPGRRWSDGLHQAVEAKEGIRPREENRTLATITLQNYFRMFKKLAGMTGTAMTEASEFSRIYKLDVVSIPPNRPLIRNDLNDQIYLDENSKLDAIAAAIKEDHARGRPVLLGTTSIAKSEMISERLKQLDIKHNVLNAKHHEREAEIIMQAGREGMVTVATNMAGRGTDIVLGGKAEALWHDELKRRTLAEDSDEAKALLQQLKQQCQAEHDRIIALGGLFVLGTERHEARRIDNQLRGRCGRQGDPGQTQFFLSFDDDLMKIFARDWVKVMMEKMGLKSGEVIDSPMVTRGIGKAQKKVEARNFDIRKNLIEYDEVMDAQRKFIYAQRQECLELHSLREKVLGMFEHVLIPVIATYSGDKDQPVNFEEIGKWVRHKAGAEIDLDGMEQVDREQLFDWIMQRVEQLHDKRAEHHGADWERLMQFLLIDTIDNKWKDHLHAIEVLKSGIGLRGYAQVDPKNEYKKESFEAFARLKDAIAEAVTEAIYKVEFRRDENAPPPQQQQRPARRPPMPMPQSKEELMALFDSLVAAGRVPPEIVTRVRSGELEVVATPEGLSLREVRPAGQAAPTGGPAGMGAPRTPEEARMVYESLVAAGQVPQDIQDKVLRGELEVVPSPNGLQLRPVQPAPGAGAEGATTSDPTAAAGSAPAAPAKPAGRPANMPKPGRNDPCPCGSGIKYKKCCAPAFD